MKDSTAIVSDDESFNLEESLSDYVSTEGDDKLQYFEYDACNDVVMKPKGYTLNVAEATLGEESKALLLWRETDSFSDWTIKVVAETEDEGDENATVYSVHRSVLAMGPKKSGHFEALFKESSECLSTVKLARDVAGHFPKFLDYMYSHPSESKAIINFANWKSMAYFASHFLVPRLTEDVMGFVEKDMYNLDHMETYLSEFDAIHIHDDLSSKCILQKATRVCAEMIRSIKVGSSLLKVISPAMFLGIISSLEESRIVGASGDALDEDRNHICDLVIEYFEQDEDEDCRYYDALLHKMYRDFFLRADVETAGQRALTLLSIMERKGLIVSLMDRLSLRTYAFACLHFLWKYLTLDSSEPINDLVNRVVIEVPNYIVAGLFSELLLWRRTFELQRETRSLRFNITLGELRLGVRELPQVALTARVHDLKRRLALGMMYCVDEDTECHYDRMRLSYNGICMDKSEPISIYEISQEDNLIEVKWDVF